jgi:tRNA(fMet)-specific endonuclease VapC
MVMKKILLDTNAYCHFLSGDETILDELTSADVVYMSVFVLGELYAGFKGGNKEQQNSSLLKKFIQKPTVELLNTTEETAIFFGLIKHNLKIAGTPIPINDVWIAAHTMESGATLITKDNHFLKIQGLRVWENIIDIDKSARN